MSGITPIKLSNSAIPVKEVLTGEELLYILDNNTSKKATTQAVANLITEEFTDDIININKGEDVTAITTLRDVLKNTSNYFIQSGAVITDNGDNTISITEAQAWVKTDIADNSEFKAVKIVAKDLTIEADKNILIYINYNAGVATFEQTESTPGFFYSYYNKIPFATCVNIGDSIIVNNFAEVGRNSIYKNTLSQINYQAFRYIGGLGTVSNVSRNVLTSPGVVIFANEGLTIAGLNTSSGGTFTRLYYDGNTWVRTTGQTVIDNANYNDVATGLAVIPNNKYAKKYLYYVKSLVDYYILIEGQMTFNDLATAKTANLPAVLPPEVSNYYAGALLVAVFIVKAGEDEIIEIQNPFKQPFSSQAASNHDNLSGLTNAASDGVINGHLTNEQYSALQNQISGGGSAYLLNLSTAPAYNADGSIKTLKQAYVSDPTKYFEQRFEYTNGLTSKIEIKDDIAGKWVRKTNIYDSNGQLQVPTIADITEWTII